ncbi:glycine receptor subunit alpha-3 isoform X3 [Procambarus clarkii]|uniref:glycine receptor subunit alpha-3 isoform X3 n=1 Tax=Procambarus clarkii TaxID=6728 RepID=UPI0037439D2D
MMWQGQGGGGCFTVGACLGVLLLHLLGQAEGNAQKRFLEEKLKDYDVNTWPNSEASSGRGKRSSLPAGVQLPETPPEATTVKIQMFINSFGSLNAANMDYSIDVFLRQHWNDPRLSFNHTGKDRFTITNPEMQRRIWKPDTYFNNVKDAEIHQVTMPNILLRLYSNGDILYSMRVTLTLACSMEFENYPFDAQVCGSSISSYANTVDVITYEWVKVDPIQLPDELEIAQFDLLSHETESFTQHFVTGNFSGLKVHFSLRRQNGYHVLQTYVPTILIVSISWVSFWLDPNAVPGRVSLGVTTLLTLTTLASGIRAQLPPVSYVKAIDVWIGMCMIMVFGALLEFTLVNWLANKKIVNPASKIFKIPKALAGSDAQEVGCHDVLDEKEPGQEKQVAEDVEDPAAKAPKTYMNHARAFDRLCRALFPITFFVFNLIYWPYYLTEQHKALQD